MEIRKFDETFNRSIFVDLGNQMNAHFNPENPFLFDEAGFSTTLVQYDLTDLSRDALIAVDEQGTVKGTSLLFKRSKSGFWYLDVVVSPELIDSSLPEDLLEAGLQLAREQGAPAIHINHHVAFQALSEKLEGLGHKPVQSSWSVRLEDFNLVPKFDPSPSIVIRKQEGDQDLSNYAALYNEVFKETLNFEPTTVEDLKGNEEALGTEEFERWFAFEGGTMTGFMILQQSNNPEQKHKGNVNFMGVLPSHQRQGVGSALIAKGIQRLQEKGCTVILSLGSANLESAKTLFYKFGFSDESGQDFVSYSID